jgi:hypothetical protein
MRSEHLFRTLDTIQTQVRAFDTKAQIVLGVDGIILGFLSLNGATIGTAIAKRFPNCLAIGLSLAYIVALLTLVFSLYYVFATVRPRKDFGQPTSRLFFFHLTSRYEYDYETAKKDLAAMTEDELGADLAEQILANAHVCDAKSNCLNRALFWLELSVGAWVSTLCAVVFFAAIHGW